MAAEREHLRNKIEIIHNYNTSYVPEFDSLALIDDLDHLNNIHQQALTKVRLENHSKYRRAMETILPLFNIVEERSQDPSILVIANFMLMTIRDTIISHRNILSQISSPNTIEERCLELCHGITNLHQNEICQFFPLFKEYLMILVENHDKISCPLSFDHERISGNSLLDSQCLII